METDTNTAQYEAGYVRGRTLALAWAGYIVPGHLLRDCTTGQPDGWLAGFWDAIGEAEDMDWTAG